MSVERVFDCLLLSGSGDGVRVDSLLLVSHPHEIVFLFRKLLQLSAAADNPKLLVLKLFYLYVTQKSN